MTEDEARALAAQIESWRHSARPKVYRRGGTWLVSLKCYGWRKVLILRSADEWHAWLRARLAAAKTPTEMAAHDAATRRRNPITLTPRERAILDEANRQAQETEIRRPPSPDELAGMTEAAEAFKRAFGRRED